MNKDETMTNILLELSKQNEIIQQLKNENKLLKQEIKKLKEIINKDSTNSSKPPSSDNGFAIKEPKNNKNTDKKRGSQIRSTGNNLKRSNKPDIIKILKSDTYNNCKHDLKGIKPESVATKQVFDIPKIKMEVTQFSQYKTICPCCNTSNKPNFPDGLNSYVQYGDNIKAFIAYLNTYQMVPYSRITELIEDFTSHKMSGGTIYNMLHTLSNKLELFEKATKKQLLYSAVINIDETGTNIAGKLHWSHVISTSKLTYGDLY